uniref:Neur_chan_LBD domain-containing protein n=1 Tax=Enterobius vermicularis TaxID=51028 RepID=A0A0N4VGZ7_ENTVE
LYFSSWPTQCNALPPGVIPRGPQTSNTYTTAQSYNARRVQNDNQTNALQAAVIYKLKSDKYDSSVPPISKPDQGVIVYVRLLIHRLIWFDNQAEAHISLKEQWQDPRFQVHSKQAVTFRLPDDIKIWVPDTYFSNAVEKKLGDKVFRIVEESGYIDTHQKNFCTNGFQRYPQLSLLIKCYPKDIKMKVTKFKIVARDIRQLYSSDSYSCLEINLTFVGPIKQGIFKVFLPSLLLVFASWLHFWINGSWSVPRTLSAGAPFLIFAILLMFFPNMYEDYSRGTRTWFVTCLLFTFASFVEYFLVICCGMRRTLRYTNGLLESDHPVTTKEVTTTTISMNNSSFNKRAPLPLCSSLNLNPRQPYGTSARYDPQRKFPRYCFTTAVPTHFCNISFHIPPRTVTVTI